MLDKVLKHIHHYYIKPRKGAPPWWLNLLVLLTSLILVCFIWQPIKVFTVSEPISFSEERGDTVYVFERSWFSSSSRHTPWMKIQLNNQAHWCHCGFSVCTYKGAGPDTRFRKTPLEKVELLLINQKYCLVTKLKVKGRGETELSSSSKEIKEDIKQLGPVQEYVYYKIFLGMFLLVYAVFVYKDK